MTATHIHTAPLKPQPYWMAPTTPAQVMPQAPPAIPPMVHVPQALQAPVRTASRVRWGRIILTMLGATTLAIGVWTTMASHSTTHATLAATRGAGGGLAPLSSSDPNATIVAASGANSAHTQGKPGEGLPAGADTSTAPAVASTTPVDASADSTPTATAAPTTTVTSSAPMKGSMDPATTAAPTPAPGTPAVSGGGGAPVAAPGDPAVDSATTAPRLAHRRAPVRGGGTTAAQLPYTGAETWIIAVLGISVLLAGILIQIHAVRIGMTAMLYRRGILLRPVDCARLVANQSSLASLRVAISNFLHYLLAEPAGADFVTAR